VTEVIRTGGKADEKVSDVEKCIANICQSCGRTVSMYSPLAVFLVAADVREDMTNASASRCPDPGYTCLLALMAPQVDN
jgi:hypothetical protein